MVPPRSRQAGHSQMRLIMAFNRNVIRVDVCKVKRSRNKPERSSNRGSDGENGNVTSPSISAKLKSKLFTEPRTL